MNVSNDSFFVNREKQKISRSVRTLEKRLRDATAIADESRKQADANKEQARHDREKCSEIFFIVIVLRF
jgi:hypothetical protein